MHSKSQQVDVNIRAFSQGFFRQSSGKMIAVADPVNAPSVCDTVVFGLIDTVTNQNVHCQKLVLMTDGTGSFVLPNILSGSTLLPYIRFRNTLKLFPNYAVHFISPAVNIDLTDAANVSNCDTSFGVAKAYSGDINADGLIELTDFLLLDSDILNNATGYLISDLNGDHVADSLDYAILDPNIQLGVTDLNFSNCITTDINEISPEINITCYPNPFNDVIKIITDNNVHIFNVMVTDVQGRIVNRLSDIYPKNLFELQAAHLSSGIYFLTAFTDKGIMVKKISKQ